MHFRHPDVRDGSLSFEQNVAQIRRGIVTLPESVGRELGFQQASDAEVDAAFGDAGATTGDPAPPTGDPAPTTGDQDSPAVDGEAGGQQAEGGQPIETDGEKIVDLNVFGAITLVKTITSLDALVEAQTAEKANDKHPGGRKAVLEAIETRFKALAQ